MKYLFLFSLLIFACGKSPEETTQNLSTQTLNLSTYGDPEFLIPTLPDNVRAEVIQWGAFEDFEEQANTINGNSLEILKEKSNLMVSHVDSIFKKIPAATSLLIPLLTAPAIKFCFCFSSSDLFFLPIALLKISA